MANNLVVAEGTSLLAFSFGAAGSVAAVLPITLGLDTVTGNSTTAGTEVAGGSYSRQTFTSNIGTPEQISNSNVINFTGMPAVGGAGVTGITIRDSAGTPVSKWRGPLTAAKTTNAGDTLSFAVAAVAASLT
jgi:hypothetical protein